MARTGTRVHLGGGGSEHDEAALWDEVFTSGQRVSTWPFALPPGPARAAGVRWFTSALAARGDFSVDAWGLDPAEDRSLRRLRGSQVLAVPGGNTFLLLHELRRHDLLAVLAGFLACGGQVYGGSAGAILLGADIAIAGAEDRDDVGVQDTRGLDRLAGAVVRPHHRPGHDAGLRRWARQHRQVVLALPERSGLVVTDDGVSVQARNVGPAAVQVFTPTGQHTHPVGATWTIPPVPPAT